MVIDRRRVLAGLAGVMTAPRSFSSGPIDRAHAAVSAREHPAGELFFTSARMGRGSYAFIVLDEAGRIIRQIPLEARGHDAVVDAASGRGVVFARRPGTFAVAFDARNRAPPTAFHSPPDRHFYGHGVLSRDGRLLYATENDFEGARGVIGIYDVDAGFERIGEFESHGIGPHDLLLAPDGRTLVVANGGIETHPDAGRAKLNVATMEPSLVFIDSVTGDLLARHRLGADLNKLSIRHLDIDARGRVWFGGQWEGGLDETPSVVGSAARDGPLELLPRLTDMGARLRGYIGSVAVNRDGRLLAASAPRAGRILYIDTETGRVAGETLLPDGCGIAPFGQNHFFLTSGEGRAAEGRPGAPADVVAAHEGVRFDNHVIGLASYER